MTFVIPKKNDEMLSSSFNNLSNTHCLLYFLLILSDSFSKMCICGVIFGHLYCRHEIVGVVTEVGSNVKGFKVGDHAGVGTYVNSCGECEYCNDFLEVHCSKGSIFTFNGLDSDGTITKGGYSSYIIVKERQVTFHEQKFLLLFRLDLIIP